MSNYTQTTFFAPKDALLSGNPLKLIKGADVDPELNAIAVAIATKYDGINFLPANPGSTIGLAAVNGSATTWMRSDAAPALSQAIVPTWTGLHTFVGNAVIDAPATSAGYGIFRLTDETKTNRKLDIAYIGSTAGAVYGATAGNVVIDTATGVSMTLSTADTARMLLSSAGNVTINAPSTGDTVTISAASTLRALTLNSAASFVSLAFAENGVNKYQIIDNFSSSGRLSFVSSTTAAETLGMNQAGNVTIAAPTSGNTLLLSGAANAYVVQVNAPNTTGQSFGTAIQAGTNTTDNALQIANAANSLVYLKVRGDGVVTLGQQPMFNAQRITSAQTLANSSVSAAVFNSANSNQSSSYATGTGIFTAPVAGVYVFTAGINLLAGNTPNFLILNAIYFSKNAATSVGSGRYDIPGTASNTTQSTNLLVRYGGSVTLVLAAGDTVRVNIDVGAPNGTTTTNVDLGSYFSGYLLG